MYKIIAFIGQSGSGKDSLMQRVLTKNLNLHEIVSCTTRPPRENEKNGISYYFYSRQQFEDKILNDEMLEATYFNDWLYGTSYESLRNDCLNIGVFNPSGVESLMINPNIDILIFQIIASDKTRLLRQLNRESNPDINEIIRRFKADAKDFSNIDFKTIKIKNEDIEDLEFGTNKILEEILAWSQTKGKKG